MSATLLTALLLAAGPADLPAKPAPAPSAPLAASAQAPAPTAIPAPAMTAEPAAAPAPAPAATGAAAPEAAPTVPDLRLPRSGVDASTLVAPLLVIAGLGGAAWVLRKRRRPAGRRVEVLETTSLGPKRSLILARFEDELLLLGASESGIQLLRQRPGLAEAPAAEPTEPELPAPAPAPREPPSALAGLVTKLRRVRPGAESRRAAPQFDSLLAESAEDQELRRKLARGLGGNVR